MHEDDVSSNAPDPEALTTASAYCHKHQGFPGQKQRCIEKESFSLLRLLGWLVSTLSKPEHLRQSQSNRGSIFFSRAPEVRPARGN
mmetsp:Transcript_76947/g.148657  ORF Transcript_76947/g.148657 Transcript_76947/m.148657 type:complete len:86 (+) Transcript_76947:41-298(+)